MFEESLRKFQQAMIDSGADYIAPGEHLPEPLDGADFAHPYYPAESHLQHVEIISLISGEMAVLVNGLWHCLKTPRPIIFLRGTQHTEHWLSPEQDYTLLWVVVVPDGLNLHYTMYNPADGYRQSGIRLHTTSHFAGDLWQASQREAADIPEFHALLLESIDYPLRHGGFDTSNSHRDAVFQTRRIIDQYYFRPLSLEELGAMAHYAPPHLNRIFRRYFGCSIHACLLEVRLKNAARMLCEERMKIRDAAEACGFTDQRYFSRVFLRRYGLTPGDYQKKQKSPEVRT